MLGAAPRCSVTLWKGDCDGLYNTDPTLNPDAQRYGYLTHKQALALASGGANVSNEKAAQAAIERKVTILVRRTFGVGSGTPMAADSPDCGLNDGTSRSSTESQQHWVSAPALRDPGLTQHEHRNARGQIKCGKCFRER
jgi:aspartokinase